MQDEEAVQYNFDPEKLIKEIKKRPPLWDLEDPDYRTKQVRQQLWKEVVHELMETDDNADMSKSELRELEMELQKKWKSIRDSFQKYVTKPHKTRRPYIYTRQLQFLWKTKGKKSDEQNASESDEDYPQLHKKQKNWKTTKRTLKLKNRDQQSTEEDIDNDDDNDNAGSQEMISEYLVEENVGEIPAKIPRTSSPNVNEFAFANVDAVQIQTTSVPVKSEEDPDKLFLLSLLPHMKSIPESFRLNVKMDMMQVLKTANHMSNKYL